MLQAKRLAKRTGVPPIPWTILRSMMTRIITTTNTTITIPTTPITTSTTITGMRNTSRQTTPSQR